MAWASCECRLLLVNHPSVADSVMQGALFLVKSNHDVADVTKEAAKAIIGTTSKTLMMIPSTNFAAKRIQNPAYLLATATGSTPSLNFWRKTGLQAAQTHASPCRIISPLSNVLPHSAQTASLPIIAGGCPGRASEYGSQVSMPGLQTRVLALIVPARKSASSAA